MPEPDASRPANFESSLEDYPVKLDNFEGPLDLLLHLIRRQEVDIYDIPILLITRQYLDYLDLMKELDLDIAGEFLVMAATLIHIKARTLVPRLEPDVEEETESDGPPRLVSDSSDGDRRTTSRKGRKKL